MTVWGSMLRMPEAEPAVDSIARINAELERAAAPHLMTEKIVERLWSQARRVDSRNPSGWLLQIRLAEAALLCAGNYTDNCEYEAAGDLLVNPREILVHELGHGRSTTKNRHGRLSEQFGLKAAEGPHALKRFSAGVCLEITKPPMLPHMTQVLRGSECISAAYLQRLEEGQRRIAETLAFLAAWRIFDPAQLWRQLQQSSAAEKAFAESHLCRFDERVFNRIGVDLRRSLVESDYRSTFLAEPLRSGHGLKGTSPAAPLALAQWPA